ncbi:MULTISPECIES: carbohydrate ABC transporter permease [Hungatella]|nr:MULTISPECIES: carbohydrate ABC transporter permease [Hungatella]MDU0929621.1 carbohydrate ABC transporter permease [Hungatella hathewayi]
MMRKSSKVKIISGDRVFDLVVYTLAFFMVLLIAYPLWFVILASFSSASDISRGEVWIWPKEWLLDGYRELINQKDVWTGYRNTIFYTITGTLFSTSVNVSAGFALSRKELLGRKWISIFYLIPMFVSGGLIPTFLVVKQFGFVDSFWVMIIPFAVSCYNIIVSRTFFSNSLPDGLWEAAQIDGCGTLRYFFRIALPLSKAILAVNALWTAVWLWNSWFNALIYLNTESLQPLQLALRRILIINATGAGTVGQEAIEMRNKADMMRYGAIVISTLPIMCLYPFLQKYFNQGVMIGSLKE